MRNQTLILFLFMLLVTVALRGQETRKLSFDVYAGPTLKSVKPGPVFMFTTYQFGLLNISHKIMLTDENGLPLGELGFKNRALFFGLGYRI